jgi:hypothetical protein
MALPLLNGSLKVTRLFRIPFALCLVAAALSSTSAVFADTGSKIAPPRQYRPPSADREYASENLTQPVDIPGVPIFTGKSKFLSGLRYPNDRSGYRIGLTYAVAEDETQVLDWYKSSLATYSWKLLPDMTQDGKTLTAVKDGNTFTVRISPNHIPGYRTVMVLSFKAVGR